jgi:hypothetical protein
LTEGSDQNGISFNFNPNYKINLGLAATGLGVKKKKQ